MSSKLKRVSVVLGIFSLVLFLGVSEIRAQSTGCTTADCVASGSTAPTSSVTLTMTPAAEVGLCIRTSNTGGIGTTTANGVSYTWNVAAATNRVTDINNGTVTPDYSFADSTTAAVYNGVKVNWAITSSGQTTGSVGTLSRALVASGTTGRTFEGTDASFTSATSEANLGTALDQTGSAVVSNVTANQSLCSTSFTSTSNGPFNCADGTTLADRAIIGKIAKSDDTSSPSLVGATYTFAIAVP